VIIYTTSMDVVRPGAAGTDFTMQIVITHISSLAIAVLSGKVAGAIGYQGLFAAEVLLGILTLLVILYAMPRERKKKSPSFYVINNKFAGVTSPMKT
jgi:predicted MFS family arabinose efflux permease